MDLGNVAGNASDGVVHAVRLQPREVESWEQAAAAMHVPFEDELRIHPQDETFLQREVWDLDTTPRQKFPLLLHYHQLVIYRHQVLKQADIVLAMFLLGNEFSEEQKRRNFDYYDPLTTGLRQRRPVWSGAAGPGPTWLWPGHPRDPAAPCRESRRSPVAEADSTGWRRPPWAARGLPARARRRCRNG